MLDSCITPQSVSPQPPSATSPLGQFIAQLSRLVLEEAETARRQVQQVWMRPVAARVAAGRAISGITIKRGEAPDLLVLRCTQNESRFREGDILCLNSGNPFDAPNLLVTLEADEDTELLVSSEDAGLPFADLLERPDGWVLDEGFLDFSATTLDALNQAADTAAGRERILPLLTGQRRPQLDMQRYEQARAAAERLKLNEQQIDAVASAYASDLGYVIQGPPGTGKTLVLACIAQLMAEEGQRVLITGFTHRAINNALNTFAKQSQRNNLAPVTAIKIGRSSRADNLLVENYESFEASPLAEQNGAYVLGATPFATRTRRLSGVEFDTVIFDEASQITLPLAIMGMLTARHFIFIGDHRQLPPVLATHYGSEALRDSVFAALVDQGFDTMLEETYRLNAELAAWPSTQFYDGRLQPATAEIAQRRVCYPRQPARLGHILNPEEPLVFVDLQHRNATTRNDAEASLAVDLITSLLDCGVPASEIGVVTPYRAQSRAIRGLLRQALPDDRAIRQTLVVDTVERMQGQERDIVIVSLTSSNPSFASQIADFLFQPERLNVAITRPRSKLIILGSRYLLDAQPADEDHQEWVELLRNLLESCTHRVPMYLVINQS